MRSVYLIRHGHPDFPIASRICLGQTDTPLGPLGQLQGVLLARAFAQTALTAVYTSPLRRAYDTARYLSDKPIVKTIWQSRRRGSGTASPLRRSPSAGRRNTPDAAKIPRAPCLAAKI